MTKDELIKKVGCEEQANYALGLLLRQVKWPLVESAIRAELAEIEAEIAKEETDGFLYRANGSLHVNWMKEHEPLDGESFWTASEEKKALCDENSNRLNRCETLLYNRNRVSALLCMH